MFTKFKVGDYVVRGVRKNAEAQLIIEIKGSGNVLVFSNEAEKGLAIFYRFATDGEIKRAKMKKCFLPIKQ